MTRFAPLVVLTAVTGETRSRVDPAVDLVLGDIISPVRHGYIRGILILVARLDLFLVCVASGAERLRMAEQTSLLPLGSIELVRPVVIRFT